MRQSEGSQRSLLDAPLWPHIPFAYEMGCSWMLNVDAQANTAGLAYGPNRLRGRWTEQAAGLWASPAQREGPVGQAVCTASELSDSTRPSWLREVMSSFVNTLRRW